MKTWTIGVLLVIALLCSDFSTNICAQTTGAEQTDSTVQRDADTLQDETSTAAATTSAATTQGPTTETTSPGTTTTTPLPATMETDAPDVLLASVCVTSNGNMSFINQGPETTEELMARLTFLNQDATVLSLLHEKLNASDILSDDGENLCTPVQGLEEMVCTGYQNYTAANRGGTVPYGDAEGDTNILQESSLSFNGNIWSLIQRWYYCTYVSFPHIYFGTEARPGINICNNGLSSPTNQYSSRWPYPLSQSYRAKYYDYSPTYWAQSDEILNDYNLCTKKRSKVFYHRYDRSDDASFVDQYGTAMVRAYGNDSTFTASSVLVITWENLPPNRYYSCPYYVIFEQVYTDPYYDERRDACRRYAQEAPVNTFQAVYITDGSHTFRLDVYPNEGLTWSHPRFYNLTGNQLESAKSDAQSYEFPVIGAAFRTQGDTGVYSSEGADNGIGYLNEWSSTFKAVDLDDMPAQSITGSTGVQGMFFVQMDMNEGDTPEALCRNFLDTAVSAQDADLASEINVAVPCPDSLLQLFLDRRFSGYWSYFSQERVYCRSPQRPVLSNATGSENEYRHTCCYQWSYNFWWGFASVTRGPRYGGYVNHLNQSGELDNSDAFLNCCHRSQQYCAEFHEKRGAGSSEGYVPPRRFRGWGDPHIFTLDGLGYTFNGLGEYNYLTVANTLKLQGRTEATVTPSGSNVTVWSSFAIQDYTGNGSAVFEVKGRVTLSSAIADQFILLQDGVEVDLSSITNETTYVNGSGQQPTSLTEDGGKLSISFYSGIGCDFGVFTNSTVLSIACAVPTEFQNNVTGLSGHFDGNISNDLQDFNGTLYADNSTDEELFPFGESWRLAVEDSLFTYTSPATYSTYNDLGYTPSFLSSLTYATPELEAQANERCGSNAACKFDVQATGDLEFGANTKEVQDVGDEADKQLQNFPPSIAGPAFIEINNSLTEMTISLNISDDEPGTLNFTTIPTSSTVVGTNGTNYYVWTFTVGNVAGLELEVTVQDVVGATSTYRPLVALCNCLNGNCTGLTQAQVVTLASKTGYEECTCSAGYGGDSCDADLDACEAQGDPCFPEAVGGCLDSPAPAGPDGYTCGPCPVGMSGDGKVCEGINECENTTLCSAGSICVDLRLGFDCVCIDGYIDNGSGTCVDINECVTTLPCHQTCNNTEGAYTCSCETGFILNADNVNCDPANPCNGTNPCDVTNGICGTVNGSKVCSCAKGFEVDSSNQSVCNDVNECAGNPCGEICTDLVGSFSCSCNSGKSLSSDGFSCIDTNECFDNTDNCTNSQECTNTVGGFNCSCPFGSEDRGNGTCAPLSDAEKPADVAATATSAERTGAVEAIFGIPIAEYTKVADVAVRTQVVNEANHLCDSAEGCTGSSSRKKRSSHGTFTFLHVLRVDGYPAVVDANSIKVVFYLNTGSFILGSAEMLAALTNAAANISTVLGGASVTGLALFEPTTSPPTATAPEALGWWIWLIVGLGAVLIIIIIVVVVLYLKNAKNRGKVSQGNRDEEELAPVRGASASPTRTGELARGDGVTTSKQ